jgi:hypothetical protein
MQAPTLKNVRIRSTRDALHVFYGVARNVLPLITRRLDAEERRAIAPGNVYVWEERGANTESTGIGMERWTDGMGWGPSRVRDVRLIFLGLIARNYSTNSVFIERSSCFITKKSLN